MPEALERTAVEGENNTNASVSTKNILNITGKIIRIFEQYRIEN